MILEAIENFYTKPQEKPREIGHYFASELWYIYKGYTTTGNFFKKDPPDKKGMANMFRGSACEDMLCKILTGQKVDFKSQERFELKVDDGIFISGKLDFNFSDYILETKCPEKPTSGVPDKWSFQLETYFRMTGKKVFLGIFDKEGDSIIRFFPFEPSDVRWELIKQTLINFHEKLVRKNVKVEKSNIKTKTKCA
jgi:hypothetical protein